MLITTSRYYRLSRSLLIATLFFSLFNPSLRTSHANPVNYANTILELPLAPKHNETFIVGGFHEFGDRGGGLFCYDETLSQTKHDGGLFIAPQKISFLADWPNNVNKYFESPTTGNGIWKRVINDTMHLKWYGAIGNGISDDTLSIQKAIDSSITNNIPLNWAGFSYKFSDTIKITSSNAQLGISPVVQGRWDDKSPAASFIYAGPKNKDMVILGAVKGEFMENFYFGNALFYPQSDFSCNRGIVLDGSNTTEPKRNLIRGGILENISVQRCGSHGVELLGNVFDVVFYNLTSRKHHGACLKTSKATVIRGLDKPDQITLYNPMLFSLPQRGDIKFPDAWALDARGIQIFSGNIQGSLGARIGFSSSIRGTHIENDQGKKYGSNNEIGIEIWGQNVVVEPSYIAGFGTGIRIGSKGDGMMRTSFIINVPLVDCKSIDGSIAFDLNGMISSDSQISYLRIIDTQKKYQDNRITKSNLTNFKEF